MLKPSPRRCFVRLFSLHGLALLAIALALLAFHYYLMPSNHFFYLETGFVRAGNFGGAASDPVFHNISRGCVRDFGAEESNRRSKADRSSAAA
jgi:hypothetical protein